MSRHLARRLRSRPLCATTPSRGPCTWRAARVHLACHPDLPQNARHHMTRTRYGIPPWLEGAPKKPTYPALTDHIEVPVAIIGGGLAGAAAAYACAAPGVPVALLETDRVRHGPGGRGPGVIPPTPPAGFVEAGARPAPPA